MFSKTLFKQTVKQNWKLWAVFTALTAIVASVFIAIYDPKAMQGMSEMIASTGLASMMGDRLDGLSSLLGMLGENFYGGILGSILPIIYVIMTCNTLVASQVDKGSMAYTLSTPIKRSKVVITQAVYMIGSLFLMYSVVVMVGLGSLQVFHNGLWGESYTADITAIAEESGKSEDYLEDNIPSIMDNENALKTGAKARNIDEDVYKNYLNLVLEDKADEAIANTLNKDVEDVSGHYDDILNNEKALEAGAEVFDISSDEYKALVTQKAQSSSMQKDQQEALQAQFLKALSAGADELDIDEEELKNDLTLLKDNSKAMEKASSASGLKEEVLTSVINQQLASSELALDEGIDFNIKDYIILNFGAFLLMFAYSGISFMFSCIFNLTKYSLAFGAGIPIASILFSVMATTSSDLEFLKYASLNTLYDTSAIVNEGSYGVNLTALFVIGSLLYGIGVEVFKRKDLPL
ncbi:ABC-2 transporter permease [Aerococcus sanguinicola]|uniref:ABC transporter permease n=1 Tax=Aerococcus sanguinicola TaxID=119206 RepID=A0A2I1MQE1_9LACT|nr:MULTISPECIES: ABC-2 transporter permease [Aerococcus]MDK7050059.1 ABC-2 transporter permease [Aerococcus sanguinicola]OFT93376.1 hypothetical protein HMPREF3090_06975 [Aerococcus sp. HMSC23C02]PKZ22339.1 hypothetical protein CYJ28_04285 [Aerococcus sanguinicola]